MSGFIYGHNPNADTLDGLDSAAFALLAGRAGGQVLQGGTAANEDLTLEGTAHATKATSYVILQPTAGNVGINTTSPLTALHVVGAATITGGIRPAADGTTALTLCKANGDAVVTVDTTNGRFGIGGAPATLLHVYGATGNEKIAIDGPLTSERGFAFKEAGTAKWDIYIPPSTDNLMFWGNGANRLSIIRDTGNFGVGVDAPATRLDIGAGAMTFAEMTAPGAGAANTARIYAVDNGAGKTQLMVQFGSGAAQQISIEP